MSYYDFCLTLVAPDEPDELVCACGETETLQRYRGSEWWCEKCIQDEEEFIKREESKP